MSEDPYHTEFVSWRVDHFYFCQALFFYTSLMDVQWISIYVRGAKKNVINGGNFPYHTLYIKHWKLSFPWLYMIHYSRFQFLDLNNIYDIISNKSFDHFAETDKTTITVYQLLQQNYHHFFLFNKLGLPAWFAIETEVIKIQTRIFFPAVDFWNY